MIIVAVTLTSKDTNVQSLGQQVRVNPSIACHTLLCLVIPCHALSCSIVPCHILSRFVVLLLM